MGPRPKPLAERFWPKVRKSDGCWEWTAAKNACGYGVVACRPGRPRLAHRVAWGLVYGEVDTSACVLHRCDNPSCVRPDHLFLGTQLDNVADMNAKKRGVRPGRGSLLKGLPDHVMARLGQASDRQLGREAGVSHHVISLRRKERGIAPFGR